MLYGREVRGECLGKADRDGRMPVLAMTRDALCLEVLDKVIRLVSRVELVATVPGEVTGHVAPPEHYAPGLVSRHGRGG